MGLPSTSVGAAITTDRRTIVPPPVLYTGGGGTTADEPATPAGGSIGLRTQNVAADYDYIVVMTYTP